MALMFSGNAVPQEQDDDVKAILGKLNALRDLWTMMSFCRR